MNRTTRLVLSFLTALLVATGTLTAITAPSDAATKSFCNKIAVSGGVDGRVCINVQYTPTPSGKGFTVTAINVICAEDGEFNSIQQLDGYGLSLNNQNGKQIVYLDALNSDVTDHCMRTFPINVTAKNTTSMVLHYTGKARINFHRDPTFDVGGLITK